MLDEKEDLFTPKEISYYLRVHLVTIYRWIADGRIESSKIGRHRRITKDALNRFLEEGQE